MGEYGSKVWQVFEYLGYLIMVFCDNCDNQSNIDGMNLNYVILILMMSTKLYLFSLLTDQIILSRAFQSVLTCQTDFDKFYREVEPSILTHSRYVLLVGFHFPNLSFKLANCASMYASRPSLKKYRY